MSFEEKTVKRTEIYKGRVVHLVKDEVLLPNGLTSERELIFHPGAVGVLASPTPDTMLLVRQYRKALEQETLEIPAGKIEPLEVHQPLEVAQRELEEETGYQAQCWEPLGALYVAPGYSNERIDLFYATDLTQPKDRLVPDEDEFLSVECWEIRRVWQAILNEEILDGKTVCAVQRLMLMHQL